ncbi:hypothetical protein [Paludisphaera rhizosphaerae]|uniref:hypothetical protein n=1 Tax=Paludisphaera rhizosphaerae TaxID=2711216 RepID=UPI0013EDBA77|nr:hypothetical protein [Paludisphaera rhizosphaerae]
MATTAQILEAKSILDAMRVALPGPKVDVFQIGSASTPLNLASQQQRAFKLTWALEQLEKIENKSIAVIGAGLAGVAAATACLLQGAKRLAIYDRNHEPMAYQYGAAHRYIHPLIYRWPEERCGDTSTDFPILNWNEGTADEVRHTVLKEAERLLDLCYKTRNLDRDQLAELTRKQEAGEDGLAETSDEDFFHYRLGSDVRQIVPSGDQIQVLAEGRETAWVKHRRQYLPVGPPRNFRDRYDVVIAAVGFGLETEFEGVPFRSYWHQEVLSQPTIRGVWPRRWLVSGTGDGGLIDAVRLRLFDLDQKALTDVLLGRAPKTPPFKSLEDWSARMKEFHAELRKAEDRIRTRYPNPAAQNANRDPMSHMIEGEYDNLRKAHKHVFDNLMKFLKSYERTDTIVYLCGRQSAPYELGASAFQRFLTYLLRSYCGLRYRSGEWSLAESPRHGQPYVVSFSRPNTENVKLPREQLEVDEIVVRHGADSALGALFGPTVVTAARANPERIAFDNSLWTAKLDEGWTRRLKDRTTERPASPSSRSRKKS